MDRIEYIYTFGMDETEIGDRLDAHDVGVLSLANEGAAYAIPVGYQFDDSSLYIRLSATDSSKKMAFLEATTEASFLLYEVEPPDDSWSIVATGELRRLTGEEREAFDATTVNREFRRLRIFDEDVAEVDLEIYELEIETLTGRKTGQ
ncbi:pyridoxamine 5'-phosphate oxidase family protein [Natrialbaceae archaeon AArc-T1-2]|uniref:pyridoxamine 5'-phosphate oxidase family protein n=1 Tax=Natrialbaceae archaeon AArc-T1-2 TaxID=3053904 RepID=UPI00255A86B6|nr:pyridoxamine 5'-phosphate oxidase family protein [Natrialbaceae archaeon AArc-T1-2]WIV68359.1 pyridoxamine 5'-phosphate oxidase family protein [Natrialbaceae archaeon AArc-T1-2]